MLKSNSQTKKIIILCVSVIFAVVLIVAIVSGVKLNKYYSSLIDGNDDAQLVSLIKEAEVTDISQCKVIRQNEHGKEYIVLFYEGHIIVLEQDDIFPSRYKIRSSRWSAYGKREIADTMIYDDNNVTFTCAITYLDGAENVPEKVKITRINEKTKEEKIFEIDVNENPFYYFFVDEFENSDYTVYAYDVDY